MIEWRPYQREALDAINAGWQTSRNQLLVAATGAGKTNILWGVVDEHLTAVPTSRVMVVAHRRDLIDQPVTRLAEFWPQHAGKAGVVMAERNESSKQIIVGTVQTLSSGRRLDSVLAHGPIDLLVVDEAHHATSDSYLALIHELRSRNAQLKLLGVTATPKRGDSRSLTKLFDREAANIDVLSLIDGGYLSPVEVTGVKTNMDLGSVAVQGSGGSRDYNRKQLNAAVNASNCFDKVIETHLAYAAGRPTVVFVDSVKGAHELADRFGVKGVPCVAAEASTPPHVRQGMLDDFRKGRLSMLVNVGLWTEGLDLPMIEVVHLARPTRSDSLYLQMVGRALRTHPGKERALVFDYEPVESRDLCQRLEELGLVPKSLGAGDGGGDGGEAVTQSGDGIEYVVLDYFQKRAQSWVEVGGWHVISFGEDGEGVSRSLGVSPDGTELWAVKREPGAWVDKCWLLESGDFKVVKKRVRELNSRYGNRNLTSRKAAWRERAPSDKQIAFGDRLSVYDGEMTAGELSDAINQKLIRRAIAKARGGMD